MSPSLAQFQHAFVAALQGKTGFAPAQQRGFRVYRNGVITACVEALRANFPAVERLTGAEWFADAAGLYARRYTPRTPSLLQYGEHMPAFLASLPSLAQLPWLPDVARLELLWLESFAAADEPALQPADLARHSPQALGDLRLRPHASVRWAWFEQAPVHSIWNASRRGSEFAQLPGWPGQGVLLVRRANVVHSMVIERDDCAFLDACHANLALATAAACMQGGSDVATRFAALLAAGAFSGSLHHDRESTTCT
jgi:hypothetical protein